MKNLLKKIASKNSHAKSFDLNSGYHAFLTASGKPVWSSRNYRKFAEEAYVRNVIAHQSVKKIASAAASVKFKLKFEGANVEKHPLMTLLNSPNPCNGFAEFFEQVYSYKIISGNSYVMAAGPKDGAPLELHTLRPDRVSIIAGKNALPSGYRYKLDSNKFKDYSASQVLHLKYFHPLDDWYGLSPVEAAAYSIDQHNQAGEWNQALLQNGARPSGALVVRAKDSQNATLSEDQYHRIKAQIDDYYAGPANAGRPILLEGGLDWKEMSLSPKDMDFIEMKNSAARDIALAFGVPPQLLGIAGDSTYNNFAEARLAFWEQTIIPFVEKAADAMNTWLIPQFGDGLKLVPDLDSVPALSPRRDEMWKRIGNADFLSDEEKRRALGI